MSFFHALATLFRGRSKLLTKKLLVTRGSETEVTYWNKLVVFEPLLYPEGSQSISFAWVAALEFAPWFSSSLENTWTQSFCRFLEITNTIRNQVCLIIIFPLHKHVHIKVYTIYRLNIYIVCKPLFQMQHPQCDSHAAIIFLYRCSRTEAKILWCNMSRVGFVTGLVQRFYVHKAQSLKTQGLWYRHQTKLPSL